MDKNTRQQSNKSLPFANRKRRKPVLTKPPPPTSAGSRPARSSKIPFLLRLHQPRNNRGNFIEYLVPALQLPAIFRALHRFIANVRQLRLAVPQILKEGHVKRTVDGLMFY